MLSHEYIMKVGRMMAQTGGQDYEPSMNDGPAIGGVASPHVGNTQKEAQRSVTILLGYVADPATGDVRIRQYASEEERANDPDKAE